MASSAGFGVLLWDTEENRLMSEIRSPGSRPGFITQLGVSASGEYIATADHHGEHRVFESASAEEVARLPVRDYGARSSAQVAFSPSDDLLITTARLVNGGEEQQPVVWDYTAQDSVFRSKYADVAGAYFVGNGRVISSTEEGLHSIDIATRASSQISKPTFESETSDSAKEHIDQSLEFHREESGLLLLESLEESRQFFAPKRGAAFAPNLDPEPDRPHEFVRIGKTATGEAIVFRQVDDENLEVFNSDLTRKTVLPVGGRVMRLAYDGNNARVALAIEDSLDVVFVWDIESATLLLSHSLLANYGEVAGLYLEQSRLAVTSRSGHVNVFETTDGVSLMSGMIEKREREGGGFLGFAPDNGVSQPSQVRSFSNNQQSTPVTGFKGFGPGNLRGFGMPEPNEPSDCVGLFGNLLLVSTNSQTLVWSITEESLVAKVDMGRVKPNGLGSYVYTRSEKINSAPREVWIHGIQGDSERLVYAVPENAYIHSAELHPTESIACLVVSEGGLFKPSYRLVVIEGEDKTNQFNEVLSMPIASRSDVLGDIGAQFTDDGEYLLLRDGNERTLLPSSVVEWLALAEGRMSPRLGNEGNTDE